jgi:hypothetical protein
VIGVDRATAAGRVVFPVGLLAGEWLAVGGSKRRSASSQNPLRTKPRFVRRRAA